MDVGSIGEADGKTVSCEQQGDNHNKTEYVQFFCLLEIIADRRKNNLYVFGENWMTCVSS